MKNRAAILCIIAMSALAGFSSPGYAQSAGSNVINLGWSHLQMRDPNEHLERTSGPFPGPTPDVGASIGSVDTMGLSVTHFWTDNFALTFDAGIPATLHLTGEGSLSSFGNIGSAKQWSPSIVAKWFFLDAASKFRPFIGAGVTYVWYSDVEMTPAFQRAASISPSDGTGQASMSSSWAPVATLGATYNFDKNWSLAFSASYIPLKTNVDVTTQGTLFGPQTYRTTFHLDPVVTFLSLGYAF